MPYSVLVLGGGQLARMMLPAAQRLDIRLTVLDPDRDCPACAGAHRAITGDFADYEAVLTAATDSEPDAATIEIEHVSTEAMAEIARRGIPVYPGAETVEMIKDKLRQRRRLRDAGLRMPAFVEVPNAATPEGRAAFLKEFGLPAIQKLRFGGYDGRGVALIREPVDAFPLEGPSMLETKVEIAREISVLVARSASGDTAVYEPFEMEMDPELHLVRSVCYPAALDAAATSSAQEVAVAAAAALSVVGLCAVELFLTKNGELLLNEVAPRPHNSGHLTLEASETDQFEQHLRAILGLPLGSTAMRGPAVMRNLVATGAVGSTTCSGLAEAMAVPGVHLHLYGKRDSRPGRKMGHLTACAGSLDVAHKQATHASGMLSIHGGESTG